MCTGKCVLAGALALLALPGAAQVYQPVPRGNDPFVFCTQGPYMTAATKIQHCWQPLDPRSGTWVYSCFEYCSSGSCPPVNAVTLGQYLALCPVGGGTRRDWRGARPANVVPIVH